MRASEIAVWGMIIILAIVVAKDHLIPALIARWVI